MKTGENLQSDTNATILARFLALIQATNHPYIGDWQNSPGSVTSTVLPSKVHFEVLAPDHSILSGNVIDYALIHSLHLNIEEATKEYRQLQYSPPLPATPDIDFRPWTTYQSTAHELELYGNPPNSSAQKWADWISCTEQYLLQEHPWAAQGRGANPHAVFKPLAQNKTVATWKKGKPAYWEQLKARFQLAVKQPQQQARGPAKGFMQALQDAPKHWVGPPTRGQFLDTYHHWHKYRDSHAAELVQHTLGHQVQEAQQAANDEMAKNGYSKVKPKD